MKKNVKKEDLKYLGLCTTGLCTNDAGMIMEALLRKGISSIQVFVVPKVGHTYVIHGQLKKQDKALHLMDSFPDLTIEEVLSSEGIRDITKECMELVSHPEKRKDPLNILLSLPL